MHSMSRYFFWISAIKVLLVVNKYDRFGSRPPPRSQRHGLAIVQYDFFTGGTPNLLKIIDTIEVVKLGSGQGRSVVIFFRQTQGYLCLFLCINLFCYIL